MTNIQLNLLLGVITAFKLILGLLAWLVWRSRSAKTGSGLSQRTAGGIKVSLVEIKAVDLPQEMRRAMSKQAEAEREKRAKIIRAEGEFQSAEKLVSAASAIAAEPVALQLRYLQTLSDIGVEQNTTVVSPCRSICLRRWPERRRSEESRLKRQITCTDRWRKVVRLAVGKTEVTV